jgi:hypothetical protein
MTSGENAQPGRTPPRDGCSLDSQPTEGTLSARGGLRQRPSPFAWAMKCVGSRPGGFERSWRATSMMVSES